MGKESVRYHNLTPMEIRELYKLVLERTAVSNRRDLRVWREKAEKWCERSGVEHGTDLTAPLAEFLSGGSSFPAPKMQSHVVAS